jgi:hypothetical protein
MKINKCFHFLTIFVFFLSCFFLLGLPLAVHAEEQTPSEAVSDYPLPYPGLLPDHPFYSFKLIRDELHGWLISNPLEKAEFDLLQSDKFVETSFLLLTQEQKKTELSFAMLAKGYSYFEDGIAKSDAAKKQGINNQDILKRMGQANTTYQEKILEMEKITQGKEKETFAKEKERMINLGKKVKELISGK